MDLTPRLLTEVEFREQWRGYSKEDVDEFLERVAAGLGELQQRLRELAERAAAAEQRSAERSDDDEIRRTLVLAQRTAASAVEEARAEAAELVAAAEERRTQLEAEMETRRAALQADLDSLAELAERQRAALRAELTRHLEALDTARPSGAPPPPQQAAGRPAPGPPRVAPTPSVTAAEPAPERVDDPPAPPAEAAGRMPGDAYDEAQTRADLVEALRLAGLEDVVGQHAEGAAAEEPAAEPAERAADVVGEPTRFFDALADDEDAASGARRAGDDPFLAELRRAVTDTEPLGPRDHAEPAGAHDSGDEPDDGSPSGRFRLRRGR